MVSGNRNWLFWSYPGMYSDTQRVYTRVPPRKYTHFRSKIPILRLQLSSPQRSTRLARKGRRVPPVGRRAKRDQNKCLSAPRRSALHRRVHMVHACRCPHLPVVVPRSNIRITRSPPFASIHFPSRLKSSCFTCYSRRKRRVTRGGWVGGRRQACAECLPRASRFSPFVQSNQKTNQNKPLNIQTNARNVTVINDLLCPSS